MTGPRHPARRRAPAARRPKTAAPAAGPPRSATATGLRRAGGAATVTGVSLLVPPALGVRWSTRNYRQREVSLLAGPALVLGAAAGSGTAAGLLAASGALAVGCYDDVIGGGQDAKGIRGHLAALRQGRVTSGAVKVAGIGVTSVLAAALGRGPGSRSALHPAGAGRGGGPVWPDVLVDAGLIAGSANLLNLLDLRPGRALKAGALVASVLRLPGPLAAALVLLPADLRERVMLGDAGANGYGALLGHAASRRIAGRTRRTAVLAGLVLLTALSEAVSFSALIEATPPLRALDRLGRLP